MRLNVGCGRMVLDGFTNCDVQVSPRAPRPPEILCDARSIPLPDGCADEVQAMHLIEHFVQWEAAAALIEWRRLLKVGGTLVLELPDLRKACQNLIAGTRDQMSMWGLYGDPGHRDEFMTHRWGYTPESITQLLQDNGFRDVRVLPPQTHGAKLKRDMRVEAVKA